MHTCASPYGSSHGPSCGANHHHGRVRVPAPRPRRRRGATAWVQRATALLLAACAGSAVAQSESWQFGAVLDVAASSRQPALGQRAQGLGLGHSDISLFGPLGSDWRAQITTAVHSHDRDLEAELEEAFVESRALPAGLQLRAGRFSSQLGYLNEQHPHSDDFVERPLLYRAFLGGHWFDDGVRLNWTAPTTHYLRLGAEVFRGRQLVDGASDRRGAGALVLSARTGGDIGRAHSWQAGLSWLNNRRSTEEAHHDHAEDEHGHGHGAAFSGKQLYLADVAWKWAPDGNNSRQQLRLAYEFAEVRDLNRHARGRDKHRAHYLSAVWRFAPSWEIGARADLLRVREPHGDHFHSGRLREDAVMLAYKPTHLQTLRLQLTRQHDAKGFETGKHAVQLQYVLSFGAHAAHAF
jgi:hypothetical protein